MDAYVGNSRIYISLVGQVVDSSSSVTGMTTILNHGVGEFDGIVVGKSLGWLEIVGTGDG